MKKPEDLFEGQARGAKNAMPDEEFARMYPTVTEYLVTTQWDDGTSRKPSTLSVFVEQGVVKVSLFDKDRCRSLFAAAETLDLAIAYLESALNASNVQWKAWAGKKK